MVRPFALPSLSDSFRVACDEISIAITDHYDTAMRQSEDAVVRLVEDQPGGVAAFTAYQDLIAAYYSDMLESIAVVGQRYQSPAATI